MPAITLRPSVVRVLLRGGQAVRVVSRSGGVSSSSSSSRVLLTAATTTVAAAAGAHALRRRWTIQCEALTTVAQKPMLLVTPVQQAHVGDLVETWWTVLRHSVWVAWDCTVSLFRGLKLIVILSPTLLVGSLSFVFPALKPSAYKWLLWSLQMAGPTFIKLGQWASTRPDILPPEMCSILGKLHAGVEPHSLSTTERTFREDFGHSMSEVFEKVHPTLLGSGCIAQVYKADMKLAEGGTRTVAIKVRHPKVENTIRRDIRLMRLLANTIHTLLPSYAWLSIPEAIETFAQAMSSQTDMREEARHLDRFVLNFIDEPGVVFPHPVRPWVSERVLVETYEEGIPIAKFITSHAGIWNQRIAGLGLTSFLKMVLTDNFVHADLHPGNLLVKIGSSNDPQSVQLVFLDAGIVNELGETDRRNFIELFRAVALGNGRLAAQLMIDRSRTRELVLDPEGFVTGMTALIKRVQRTTFKLATVQIGEVLSEVMTLVREHHVKIETNFTNLVMGIVVLEGLGRQLDPSIDLFSTALPILNRVHADYQPYAGGASVLLMMREFARRLYATVFGSDIKP